jgi:hypothetical protein
MPVVVLPALLFASALLAQDEEQPKPPPKGLEPDPKVEAVDGEGAKALLEKLEAAVEAKDENGIISVVESFFTASHEDFAKPLEKLAAHRAVSVRVAAVKALGSQGPAKKVGPVLFRILMSPQNKDAKSVMAMAIASMRRIAFSPKPVVDEIKSQFQKRADMAIMREAVRYFGDLKLVDTVPMLVEWVERPEPANPNSPTNPPASYWQTMFEIWSEIKAVVAYSLRTITGKEYETERLWREWMGTPEARKLGIR